MGTTLVIAEKPDMSKKIAEAIVGKQVQKRNGYFEGGGYIFTWAVGHLIGLADADKYDERYKYWKLEDLPIIPVRFKLVPNENTKKQLGIIKELARGCDNLINACDSAREGQLIYSYIIEYLRINKPAQRLWINSLTPEAIREGFSKLKNNDEYADLMRAAKSRSEADWLIGINGTRAFSTKFGRPGHPLSVGRVQTPVLAMIYDRQRQIENFKPEKFFQVQAHFIQNDISYKGIWQGERIFDKEQADDLVRKVNGKQGQIGKYESKESDEKPPLLYDLGLLQINADKRINLNPKETLAVAQKLYENEFITYPRTNANYVADDNIPVMHAVLGKLSQSKYVEFVRNADKSLVHTKNKNICNPKEIEDHHAIIPTGKIPTDLSANEEKLYDMIVRQFLAHFYPPARYRNHTILTDVEPEIFKTTVKELLDKGWKVLYESGTKDNTSKRKSSENEDKEDEQEIVVNFKVQPNQMVHCTKAETLERETTPPKWYTEGSLIQAMKTAGKEITDDELKAEMKGLELGTPATRAGIIETLKNRSYIEVKGKRVTVTEVGISLIQTVRKTQLNVLTSTDMTAKWEQKLGQIAKGESSHHQFMETVKKFADKVVTVVKQEQTVSADSFTVNYGVCPSCGQGTIVEGKMAYGCSRWKEGCSFKIWKEQKRFKKKLTIKNVQDLLSKGKINYSFKSKTGNNVKGTLFIKDNNTGELDFEFEGGSRVPSPISNESASLNIQNKTEQKSIGKCPICSTGEMIDKGKFYSCSQYPTCKVSIPKEKSHKKIPVTQLRKLLKSGATDLIEGFKSEKGSLFKAKLKFDNGKVVFDFAK